MYHYPYELPEPPVGGHRLTGAAEVFFPAIIGSDRPFPPLEELQLLEYWRTPDGFFGGIWGWDENGRLNLYAFLDITPREESPLFWTNLVECREFIK